ncbi:helix-turn-helix domain-containing protein [Planotetraspora kaengkrachanensis]|uniref:Transcriptional regulator n=1 Tax=Planotetraspora kaengkrachanensis TaxID=575193 RepID=A0A8J3VBL1_9ACTN|nr:helix-turn-helix transcriptional regulator [Planotetraspora kaengkrachanensis]GIG83699.1 transcriptional regulator [Planotetraspora kaengkrachanensis]
MDNDRLLGDFLRSRREATSLEDVGLPPSGRRRTPGLRREELAMLSGVSTDYYIRLEQGRERNPSQQVLTALAEALRLDADAADYMYALVHTRAWPPRPETRGPEQISPALLQLMGGWRDNPAFVIGRGLNVLAATPLTMRLYDGVDHKENCLKLVFFCPEARGLYLDWEEAAAYKVAELRAALGRDPGNPDLVELVEELSEHSEDFRVLWARHDVRTRRNQVKQFNHRDVGPVTLHWDVFTVNSAPSQQLIVMGAEPDSTSERALAHLSRSLVRASA